MNNSYRNLYLNVTRINVTEWVNATQIFVSSLPLGWGNLTNFPSACLNQVVTGIGASLVCVSITNDYLATGAFSAITGVGTLAQDLVLGNNPIRSLSQVFFSGGSGIDDLEGGWLRLNATGGVNVTSGLQVLGGVNSTGTGNFNNVTGGQIYEGSNRFPQPTACGGTDRMSAFDPSGAFSCSPVSVYPTFTLPSTITTTNTTLYVPIFNITVDGGKSAAINGVLIQNTSVATVGIQTRVRTTSSSLGGYCNFVRQSSATASANIDNLILLVNGGLDTAQTAEFNSIQAPTAFNCAVYNNGSASQKLNMEFQAEAAGTVATAAGSYYNIVTA